MTQSRGNKTVNAREPYSVATLVHTQYVGISALRKVRYSALLVVPCTRATCLTHAAHAPDARTNVVVRTRIPPMFTVNHLRDIGPAQFVRNRRAGKC